MENRNILIGLGTGLVAGFLLGYGTGAYFTTENHPHALPAAPPAAANTVSPMVQNQVEAFTRISSTKAVLEREPNNVDALVSLGNDYFDTHQPQAAVDAYAKALALDPKNPRAADILTDQGIMFRELKAYDKALANFKQASKLNPAHLPSLLNQGIVYATDLHDKPSAKKAWTRIIELAPGTPQAEQAKTFLASL